MLETRNHVYKEGKKEGKEGRKEGRKEGTKEVSYAREIFGGIVKRGKRIREEGKGGWKVCGWDR